MNILVSSPGEPVEWENELLADVNIIGLASTRNVIDDEKIQQFSTFLGSDYEAMRELIGSGGYDFNLRLID